MKSSRASTHYITLQALTSRRNPNHDTDIRKKYYWGYMIHFWQHWVKTLFKRKITPAITHI